MIYHDIENDYLLQNLASYDIRCDMYMKVGRPDKGASVVSLATTATAATAMFTNVVSI